uniref:Uncharacterized protein n=1 Tax=Globisporangium ultimum (strain ATCC 200006 / CBS 805.95 / DAOM BR144) TaxID=431595 RepID=K3X378_GLOUD
MANAIQLWKERSLYDTLQVLDALTRDPRDTVTAGAESVDASRNGASYHERQIQAIENHEKVGREMNELLQRDRTETAQRVHHAIDAFSAQLAHVLHDLIKPELEEELERELAIVDRLVQEKQKLDDSQRSLVSENQALAARIESLENDPNGGGDAILCKKLRTRVHDLSARQRELLDRVDDMEKEREKHRWAMQQMRNDLELQQRTFLMTKAMHERETKQLVDLVQHRQTHFVQVVQGTKQKVASTLESYDPLTRP